VDSEPEDGSLGIIIILLPVKVFAVHRVVLPKFSLSARTIMELNRNSWN